MNYNRQARTLGLWTENKLSWASQTEDRGHTSYEVLQLDAAPVCNNYLLVCVIPSDVTLCVSPDIVELREIVRNIRKDIVEFVEIRNIPEL